MLSELQKKIWGFSVLCLLLLLKPWLTVKIWPVLVRFKGIKNLFQKNQLFSAKDHSPDLAGLAVLLFLVRDPLIIPIRHNDFPIIYPLFYKEPYVRIFFPCTVKLLISLTAEFFLLTFDLNSSLGLTDIFPIWALSNKPSLSFSSLHSSLETSNLAVALQTFAQKSWFEFNLIRINIKPYERLPVYINSA